MGTVSGTDRSSQAEAALELLRSRIIDMTIAPGSRVDEMLLIRQYGLGRTPAREAVSGLAAEGFVRIMPNRGGIFVRKLDLDEIRQVLIAHQLVESAVGQLTPLDDDTLVDDLTAVHQQYISEVNAANMLEATALNEHFHVRIAATLRNAFVHDFAQSTHRHVRRVLIHLYALERTNPLEQQRLLDTGIAEHEAIIDAFRARDRDRVAALLPDHARTTQDRLTTILRNATLPPVHFDISTEASLQHSSDNDPST